MKHKGIDHRVIPIRKKTRKIEIDLNQLTPKEEEALIEEMAERMIDVVCANALRRTRQILQDLQGEFLIPEDVVTIKYDVNFVANDLYQIIARERRKIH